MCCIFLSNKNIEDTIIKDLRNLVRLKKIDDTTIKDIRNPFRLKEKKTKQ